jgi:hypothetical protein
LSAEAAHYEPFGVPTGKYVFMCDLAQTVRYLEPADKDGALVEMFFFALLFAVLLEVLAAPAVLGALLVGGTLLWRRGEERIDRTVGLAALIEAVLLVGSAADYAYETHRLYGSWLIPR